MTAHGRLPKNSLKPSYNENTRRGPIGNKFMTEDSPTTPTPPPQPSAPHMEGKPHAPFREGREGRGGRYRGRWRRGRHREEAPAEPPPEALNVAELKELSPKALQKRASELGVTDKFDDPKETI